MRHLIRFAWLLAALVCLPAVAHEAPGASREVQPLPSLAPVVNRVLPAVVNISASRTVAAIPPQILEDPKMREFYGVPDEVPEAHLEAAGSGVIVDPDKGYIVTNNHVIQDADELTVTLSTGERFAAEEVAVDPPTDIAVVQIKAEGDPPLRGVTWGDPSRLQAGDWVVAIGNPFGLEQSVTAGVVSALGRTGLGIQGYEDFIQTDVPINPGSSGGALVNLRGEVVGINNVILAPTGGNIGIGFAIPADMVQRVVGQLIAHGEVERGHIGVMTQDLTPDIAEAMNAERIYGALVAGVAPGSPAAESGVEVGDLIVEMDGNVVRNSGALRNMIGSRDIGDRLELKITRDGETVTIMTRIGDPPASAAQLVVPAPVSPEDF